MGSGGNEEGGAIPIRQEPTDPEQTGQTVRTVPTDREQLLVSGDGVEAGIGSGEEQGVDSGEETGGDVVEDEQRVSQRGGHQAATGGLLELDGPDRRHQYSGQHRSRDATLETIHQGYI